jgi:hypothetical protein
MLFDDIPLEDEQNEPQLAKHQGRSTRSNESIYTEKPISGHEQRKRHNNLHKTAASAGGNCR